MIKARRVRFNWDDTPLHWVPDDAFTTHVINVLHLLLPAGEDWFCHVYRQALPLITDPKMREDVKGFIGQEAIHGRAHTAVLDHFSDQGLYTIGYTQFIDWMFNGLLGDYDLGADQGPRWLRMQWLRWRLGYVAAIEHFTQVLGWWAITDTASLDAAGADPTMLDLLRWHGSEEVEHRAVAFDLYTHLVGGYLRRVITMSVVGPVMIGLWMWGTRFLIKHDPTTTRKDHPSLRRYIKVSRQTGRLPRAWYMIGAAPRYMRPGYHPSKEASTEIALAYIARSPAAQAYAA
ncbi:MAG: metal-dependent hydrolase [Acidimicrobiales bacterium]